MKSLLLILTLSTILSSSELSIIIKERLYNDTILQGKLTEYEQKKESLKIAKENYCLTLSLDLEQLNQKHNKVLIEESIKNYKMQAFLAANSYLKYADELILNTKESYIQLLTQKSILEDCVHNQKEAQKLYDKSKKEFDEKLITLDTMNETKKNYAISNTNLDKQKKLVKELIKKYQKDIFKNLNIHKIVPIDAEYHLPKKYEEIFKFAQVQDDMGRYSCHDNNSSTQLNTYLKNTNLENLLETNEINATKKSTVAVNNLQEDSNIYAILSTTGVIFGFLFLFGWYRRKNCRLYGYFGEFASYLQMQFGHINRITYEKELQIALVHNDKNHILYDISHELSTPIKNILELSQKLKNRLVSQSEKGLVERLEYKLLNLEQVIEDIVHRSEIFAQTDELEIAPFDIYQKIDFIVETYALKADNKKIEFSVNMEPNIPKIIMGDRLKLTQTLGHIIDNAIKYTNNNGIVNLIIERVSESKESIGLKFSVQDSGIGMMPEKIEEIKKKFVQIDTNKIEEFSDGGWGLVITYISLKLMGGNLVIVSEPEKGTTVSYELEFQKDNSVEENNFTYKQHKELSVGIILPHMAVKRDVDKILKKYVEFTNAKFHFYYYDDVFQSKDKITLPDILFVDYKYTKKPNEMERLLNLHSNIVFLTSKSSKRNLEISKHTNAYSLVKPITFQKIVELFDDSNINKLNHQEVNEKTILLLGQNEIQISLYTSILKNLGYNIDLAASGQEFIDRFGSYDYVIFDEHSFGELACSIASLAHKFNSKPLMLATKTSVVPSCIKAIYSSMSATEIEEKLNEAT